jgi:hypothetical protein
MKNSITITIVPKFISTSPVYFPILSTNGMNNKLEEAIKKIGIKKKP